MDKRRYVLISPSRDEAQYLPTTIRSIAAQTVRPAKWVIVDDGSKDQTPAILEKAAREYPFIEVVRREDRGGRKVGPGVIEAFYAGLERVDLRDYQYVCKLDGDLDIPRRCFEGLMERMEANPRIGTCSGKAYFPGPGDKLISEACGDEMSLGMMKFYRTECFRQIGGFVRQVMWDGIDCHRCRMLGWIACSWDDPELNFIHLRPMGSSQKSIWTGRRRHGFGQYFMGTSLTYMTASALYRMTRPPRVLGGLAMWWGYVSSMMRRQPRYEDAEFRRFLRAYQWRCLWRGKAGATQWLDERQSRKWESWRKAGVASDQTVKV